MKYLLITFALVIISANSLRATVITVEDATKQETERLDITYADTHFKEIEHDVLQAIPDNNGDFKNVILSCESTSRKVKFVKWVYHGLNVSKEKLTTTIVQTNSMR